MKIGELERDGLIAGNYPLEAEAITIVVPQDADTKEFKRGDVVGMTGDGVITLVNSSATDGSDKAIGIICDNVIAKAGDGKTTTMYVKGEFARRHLRFGGEDTADVHKRRMTEIGLLIRETKI